jgi:hypothetical protein
MRFPCGPIRRNEAGMLRLRKRQVLICSTAPKKALLKGIPTGFETGA